MQQHEIGRTPIVEYQIQAMSGCGYLHQQSIPQVNTDQEVVCRESVAKRNSERNLRKLRAIFQGKIVPIAVYRGVSTCESCNRTPDSRMSSQYGDSATCVKVSRDADTMATNFGRSVCCNPYTSNEVNG